MKHNILNNITRQWQKETPSEYVGLSKTDKDWLNQFNNEYCSNLDLNKPNSLHKSTSFSATEFVTTKWGEPKLDKNGNKIPLDHVKACYDGHNSAYRCTENKAKALGQMNYMNEANEDGEFIDLSAGFNEEAYCELSDLKNNRKSIKIIL